MEKLGLDVTNMSKMGPEGTRLPKLGLDEAKSQNVTSGDQVQKVEIG